MPGPASPSTGADHRLAVAVIAALLIVAAVGGGLGVAAIVRQLGRLKPSTSSAQPVITPPPHRGPIQLPPELTVSSSGGPVVTPEQAAAMVKTWWPLEESALAANDVALTDALESGPLAEFNDAVSRDNLVRGGNLRVRRAFTDVAVRVPRHESYPASFLALVLTTVYGTSPADEPAGTAYVEVLVFVRPGAGSPWKASLDTGGSRGSVWPPFAPTRLPGTAFEANVSGAYGYDPQSVPTTFALFNQSSWDNGVFPSNFPFLEGFWTRDFMTRVVRDQRALTARTGVHEKITYLADVGADDLYQFAVEDGRDLVCFTLRYTGISTIPGKHEYQDPRRNNWGGLLAPGIYSSIKTRGTRQTCALVGRTGEGGIAIFGGNGGNVSVTGTRP